MYLVEWDNDSTRLGTVEQVEELLDRLHEQFRATEPTLVTVERADDGDSLSIGLGLERSVLNYVRGDKNPPYYTSSGGSDADGSVSFRYYGDVSEYPLRNAIPISLARAAVKRFCESGERSESVTWEEV